MKRVIVVGASSGIGEQVAHRLLVEGYVVGVAARRIEMMEGLVARYPDSCIAVKMDVCLPSATEQLDYLISKMGDVDTLLLSAGVGWQNVALDAELELRTVHTNAEGFVRVVDHMFNYFRGKGGHIAAITSIAGTKGLGASPAYSATKRFERHYLDSLSQLARIQGLAIKITDIRPGFVATQLLAGGDYPMQLDPHDVALKIVEALKKGRRVVTIDWRYRLLVALWSAIPQRLWERMRVR